MSPKLSSHWRCCRPQLARRAEFALGPDALEQAHSYINANYGYNPKLAERRLRSLPTTSGAVEDAIKQQEEMGADEFILRPCAPNLEQMERLADIAARTVS